MAAGRRTDTVPTRTFCNIGLDLGHPDISVSDQTGKILDARSKLRLEARGSARV
jgi:hypothetical protein